MPSFHRLSMSLCRHVTKRPCYQATISPSHGATCCTTVPPAINMPQPCCRETWYDTVTLPCHRTTWCAIVPPGWPSWHRATLSATVQPDAQPCYRALWCALVPPCRRVAVLLIHISAYFLIPVNHHLVFLDNVWRNFTL